MANDGTAEREAAAGDAGGVAESGAAADEGSPAGPEDPAGAPDERESNLPVFLLVFLPGLGLFVLGAVGFLADFWTGYPIDRSLVANAVGAAALIGWAGYDSYTDPDSGVATVRGAVGTGLILLGLYLFAAGVVVAASSVVHGRLPVGLAMAGAGLPAVLAGFVALPRAAGPIEATAEDLADGEGEDG